MRNLLGCALVALGLAGCGGSGGDAGADPATALPPSAVYLEFVINPQGDQRERMEALAGKLLRTGDPGAKLIELFDSLDEGSDPVDFESDIKPWLGRRVGLVVTELAEEEPGFVAAIAAADTGEAADAVARDAAREGAKKRTHRGVDYWVVADDTLTAVHGDFVLLADSETTLQQAIDVEEGKALSETRRFAETVARLPEEREGTMYFDLRSAVDAAGDLDAAEREIFKAMFGGAPATAVAVLAEADHLALESRSPAGRPRSLATMFSGAGYFGVTPMLGDLPADSIFAAGAPEFGDTAKLLVNGLAGPLGGAVVAGQLEKELGISLERDVYRWIGDVAVFVRGTSLDSLSGGLLIDVRDRAAARRALPRLLGALQLGGGPAGRPVALAGAEIAFELDSADLPKPVFVALGKRRAVIALGRASAEAALTPGDRLRDSDLWDRGAGVLDDADPSMLVDLPKALQLAEPLAAGEPDLSRAKPYLETLTVLASGSGKAGDQRRSRLAVGVE